MNPAPIDRARAVFVALAVASPMLLAFSAPPSPTVLNGLLAIGLWGSVLATLPPGAGPSMAAVVVPVTTALLVGVAAVWAAAFSALPLSIAAGVIAVLGATIIVMLCASVPLPARARSSAVSGFWWGLAAAGLVSAVIAIIQVFAPEWPDGNWIARTGLPGRAGANLRQPNHLSSLVLWAVVAVVTLAGQQRRRTIPLLAAGASLLLAVVLTGSRTGILGTAMLATWGLIDRRLSRVSRAFLLSTPAVFALLWLAVSSWAHATGHVFGAEAHVALGGSSDASSSRFAIWSNALSLIASEAWTGVGLGEFNIAWTLSAFPDRPVAFFDHTHNLVLQLIVELGIPLGALVILLLVVSLWQAGRRAWACSGDDGPSRRAAFILVLMIGLHSMLEYPLWYAYFLLPTAFALGLALSPAAAGSPPNVNGTTSAPTHRDRTLAFAGVALSIGAAAAVLDYWRVVDIYDPGGGNVTPLEERIERGQRSPLFGHHADYAAATAFGEPKAPLPPSQQLAFKRAPHQLLDVRLMIAWSQALAAEGELDKARWLAARIREFRNPSADEFFAPCQVPEAAASSFQCQQPQRAVHWREFTQRR